MQRLIASVTSSSVRRLRFNVRRPSRKLVQREVHGFTENKWRQVIPSAKEHRVSNIDTVREIYEHSGRRGDVGVILDPLDDAVEWETQVPLSDVPWLQARPGKSNIVGFFQALAPLKITRFEPRTFFDGGDKIFVLIAFEATNGGKHYSFPNNGHLWQFDAAGKVIQYGHITDTAQMIRMAKAE
jgi:hypothetical protein